MDIGKFSRITKWLNDAYRLDHIDTQKFEAAISKATFSGKLPAYLCLRRVLHSQTFVFERGEEILPDIHTTELGSVKDVRYSNLLQIIPFFHSGSISKEYARKHFITVDAVPWSSEMSSNTSTPARAYLCRSHLASFPSNPGISLSSGVMTSRYRETSWAPSFLSFEVLMGQSI